MGLRHPWSEAEVEGQEGIRDQDLGKASPRRQIMRKGMTTTTSFFPPSSFLSPQTGMPVLYGGRQPGQETAPWHLETQFVDRNVYVNRKEKPDPRGDDLMECECQYQAAVAQARKEGGGEGGG